MTTTLLLLMLEMVSVCVSQVGLRLASARSNGSLDTNVLLEDSATVAEALNKRRTRNKKLDQAHESSSGHITRSTYNESSPQSSERHGLTRSSLNSSAASPSFRSVDDWVESLQSEDSDTAEILSSPNGRDRDVVSCYTAPIFALPAFTNSFIFI